MRTMIWVYALSLGWLFAESANAIEFERVTDFSGWQPGGNNGSIITAAGDKLNLDIIENVSTKAGFVSLTSPTPADGIMATFNISSVNVGGNGGNAEVELRKTVGKVGNNNIEAELIVISILQSGDTPRRGVHLEIRERLPSGTKGKELFRTDFAADDDIPEWNIGQDVTVAIARFGNEIWFFLNGQPTLIKYFWIGEQPLEPVDSPVQIIGDSGDGDSVLDSLTAMASNVFLLFTGDKSTAAPSQTLMRLANQKR